MKSRRGAAPKRAGSPTDVRALRRDGAGRRRHLVIAGALATAVLLGVPAGAGATSGGCPNEQLRAEQYSSQLPECRAWELASPAQKNGNNVSLKPATAQASPSGEAVAFASSGAFVDAPTSLGLGFFRSVRGPDGWSTRSTDLPQSNETYIALQGTFAFSEDLTKTFATSRVALAPGAVEEQGNAYLHDNDTGQSALLATSGEESAFFDSFTLGQLTEAIVATPDFSHVAFGTNAALTPESVAGARNLYEWGEGQLRLASFLPGNIPASEGAVPDGLYATGSGGPARLYFTASHEGNEGLYMREGSNTIAISASQRVPHSPLGEAEVPRGSVASAKFGGASADGSVVYLTSSTPLTNATSATYEERLYRYDVASKTLTALAANPNPGVTPEGISLLQVSPDGAYVYFTSDSALAAGSSQAGVEDANTNIYVFHEAAGHEPISFIAQTEGFEPLEWDVSPDGQQFAFASFSQLTSYENKSERWCPANPFLNSPPGACATIYDYDYASHELRCVSCDPSGAPPMGSSHLDGGYEPTPGWLAHLHTRNVLDDGLVFFDSPDDLTSAATNGRQDVYEWSAANGPALISGGTANEDAFFADATPNGSDVFFKTSAQLVPADTDSAYDIYDAREGGGIVAQNTVTPPPSECEGDECQGSPTSAPVLGGPPATTTSPPAESAASTPASFSLASLTKSQLTKLTQTGRLNLSVKVSLAGAVSALLSAEIAGHTRVVARGSRTARGAGTVTVTVVLSRAARRALARNHRLRLTLSVACSGVHGAKRLVFVVKQPVNGR